MKKILNTALPLSLGVFLVYYAYAQFTPEQLMEMKNHLLQANPIYIFLSLFSMLVTVFSRAYRWKFSINYLGYQSGFKNNFMAVCIGYLVNFTIPRSGEISRALVLQKYNHIPFQKSFGTIIAERIVDLLCLLLLVAMALVLEYHTIKDFIIQKIPIQKIFLFGGIFLTLFIFITYYIIKSKTGFLFKIKNKIKGLTDGIMSVCRMPQRQSYLFHTLVIWLGYLLSFYFGALSLQATAHIPLQAMLVAFIVGGLAISFTNGGLGAYPLLIAEILALYQIPITASTSFGWLIWTAQTLLFISLGLLSFAIIPLVNRSKK